MVGMEIGNTIAENWFTLLQSIGIIGSLLATIASLRFNAKVRRVSNEIEIAKHHRTIWLEFLERPGLARILETSPDLEKDPVTVEEKLFVRLLFLHLNTAFNAMERGLLNRPDGLRDDIRAFMASPIVQEVWRHSEKLLDHNLIEFIEGTVNSQA